MLALALSIWSHQCGETRLVSGPKLTDWCRTSIRSTEEKSANPTEAAPVIGVFPAEIGIQGYLTYKKTHPPRNLLQASA